MEPSSGGGGESEPDGRNALLAAIRGGGPALKPVGPSTNDKPKEESEEEGIAGALMKALKLREAALRPDDDDDDDDDAFDEDDWED